MAQKFYYQSEHFIMKENVVHVQIACFMNADTSLLKMMFL